MSDRICSGCGELKKHKARGYCLRCYQRRHSNGTLEWVRLTLSWPENLLARMEPQPNGCIHYVNGQINSDGYGKLHYPGGDSAHRAAYEHFVGPIPEDMTVGHKCHDADPTCKGGPSCLHRRCVNVEHLALESREENTNASPNSNAAKTRCKNGHEFTDENTYTDRNGARHCRACHREVEAARRKNRRRSIL